MRQQGPPPESSITPHDSTPTDWELQHLPSLNDQVRRRSDAFEDWPTPGTTPEQAASHVDSSPVKASGRPAHHDRWSDQDSDWGPDDPRTQARVEAARVAVEAASFPKTPAEASQPASPEGRTTHGSDSMADEDSSPAPKARRKGPLQAVRESVREVFRRNSNRNQAPAREERRRPAAPEEIHFDEESASRAIMSTAREYEIPLDLDRLKRLVEVARDKVTNKSEFSGQESPYDNEGLIIHPPDLEDESTSRIDFLPPSTANGVVARTPQREDMTRIMLMGIRGMQDYLLLVDAGYIARPTKIRGKTNPTMATIAKRFGFVAADPMPDESMPDSKQITVEASFDDIHEHMLSPEIRRYETLLAKRAASN